MSALGYGVSDFVGGIASRRVAALRVVLVSYPVALVLLAVTGRDRRRRTSPAPAMLWGGLCGISQAFGVWWFYAALGAGPISVVSPLTAMLVAGRSRRRRTWRWGSGPAASPIVGIVLALVAVVLVSREARDEDSTRRTASPPRWPG